MHAAQELLLPCQPRILALLMRELVSDVPQMRRINQLFGCDPVLASLLMECANASAHQMAGAVHGIPQALVLLSDRQLRALLKKAQAGIATRPIAGMDMAQFARLSYACAKQARSLAAMAGLDGSVAYVTALLHGMGQVILHHTQPERVQPLNQAMGIWDPRRPQLEAQLWGYSANSTTAALLRQWGLPVEIIAATKAMELPLACDPFDPLAGVVHLAVWCNRALHSGWSERAIMDAFPVDLAIALGMDADVVLHKEATDWTQSLY